MRTYSRPEPPLDPRDEGLFHLKWVLDCLDPGACAEIDERRLMSLFGSPCIRAFEAATNLAREKGCTFSLDPKTKTAKFQRVSSTNAVVIEWPYGGRR